MLRTHTPGDMDKVVGCSEDDLIANSPGTERHVRSVMTPRELCDAAVRYGDDTAANLLFDALGEPASGLLKS